MSHLSEEAMLLDPASNRLPSHAMGMKVRKPDVLSPTMPFISSSDACMTIVRNLMCHRKGGESEEFSKLAIESLIRKLKDRREELDSLILAITSSGSTPTGCVTIQRTLDGRMQIASRKCFPHLVYARIWRWSDVHKTELRHLSFCEFGYDLKLDWVCVNPFHYERIISSSLDISSLALADATRCHDTDRPNDSDSDNGRPDTTSSEYRKQEERKRSRTVSSDGTVSPSPSTTTNTATTATNQLRLSVKALLDDCIPSVQTKPNTLIYEAAKDLEQASNLFNIMQWVKANGLGLPLPTATPSSPSVPAALGDPLYSSSSSLSVFASSACTAPSASLPSCSTDSDWPIASVPSTLSSEAATTAASTAANQCSGTSGAGGGGGGGGVSSNGGGGGGHHSSTGGFGGSAVGGGYGRQMGGGSAGGGAAGHGDGWGQGSAQLPMSNFGLQQPPQLTTQRPPEYWCNIAYFELDQQVGELFKVPSHYSRVIVDGYTDPSSRNRFCLGQLSNVHRSEQSEKSRLYIGKGVELDNVGEGDVWIRCLSEFSVFVQSYYLDREAGRAPGDAVHKIYPGAYIKVFDIRQCYEQMKQLAHMAQAAAVRQAAAVVGSMPTASAAAALPGVGDPTTSSMLSTCEAAGVGVDDLRRLCMLRLSFVKGWGPDYPRHNIKETPCWIEIQLHRPLQLLDEVLQAMPLNDLKPTRHFFSYYQNPSLHPKR